MEDYCQQLKLNIDDTEPKNYYFCENWSKCTIKPSLLSTFRNQRCSCGKLMNRVVGSSDKLNLENGFVKETASFIVSDDLYITPNGFGSSINLFQKLGIEDMEAVEERTVDISKKEVVDLLKFSLISMTPVSDLILRKEQYLSNINPKNQNQFQFGKILSEGRQMVVKIQIRKSNRKILFAEAEEEFVDFLFSFLTFPLGRVLHMLEGFSSQPDITNWGRKFAFYLFILWKSFNIVDPKSSIGESSSLLRFLKGPAMYMVTDNLVVTPMSYIYAVSYLNSLKVPFSDLEERVITIGVKEGLGILKALLTSAFALINDLKHLIKTTKGENESITSVWSKFINKVFNSSRNFKVFRFLAGYHHCNCGCISGMCMQFLRISKIATTRPEPKFKTLVKEFGCYKIHSYIYQSLSFVIMLCIW
ncbi:hypothetical protein GmHk_07G019412 [Glycine max]|nr:hypothetical protein GmHk_07G019412 [Glycine max]